MNPLRIAIPLAAMLALAACESDTSPAGEAEVDVAADASGDPATIDLQAGGLTLPPQDGEEALEVPFGSMRSATEITLATVLGEVSARESNGECPAGAMEMTRYEGLVLNFQDDKFVGWSATEPYLPTETRAQLLANGGIELVDDSTLGEEFTIGDTAVAAISGMFTGAQDDAQVSSLWAGTNCIFR